MTLMPTAGRHLHLLMQQQSTDTEPIDVQGELMDTQLLPIWDGLPMLPPAPGTKQPRRFDRFMSWVDHSRSATVAVYGSAVVAVVVEVAILASLR